MAAKRDSNEIEQLEQRLSGLECALEEKYSRIGRDILELAESECRQVGLLVDEIIELRRQLSKARGELRCPECMSVNSCDSRYCRHCGRPLSGGLIEKEI